MLAAVFAFAANSAAWSLIRPAGPGRWHHIDPGSYQAIVLLSAPILIGSLGNIPVGVLSDLCGARVVLPALTGVAGLAVLAATLVDSPPVTAIAACALGVAGAAFPVGAALVTSSFRAPRRGLVLSGYGTGIGGVAVANLAWLRLDTGDDRVLLALAAALLGGAFLVAVVTRGDAPVRGRRSPAAAAATVRHFLRLPATRNLSAWYAAALGGTLALGLYLPPYLHVTYHVDGHDGLLIAAGVVAVAAATRPVGGWLANRLDPTSVLGASYAAVAILAVLVALRPPLYAIVCAVTGLAAGFGVAAGVVLALIGNTAPAAGVGTIVGIVGAAGGLAAVLPSLLLAASYERTASANVWWALLAGVAATLAMYIRGQRGWRGAALAFVAPADGAVTTVVSLVATDADRNSEGVVLTLGALAGAGDLVIVYGYCNTPPEMPPHTLVAKLRARLPRHVIVTVYVDTYAWRSERGLIADVLGDGGIILICTPTTEVDTIAVRLADRLGAVRLLRLTDESIDGLRLSLPWPADVFVTR